MFLPSKLMLTVLYLGGFLNYHRATRLIGNPGSGAAFPRVRSGQGGRHYKETRGSKLRYYWKMQTQEAG